MDNKDAWDAAIAELTAKLNQVKAALKPAEDMMKSVAESVGKEAAERQNALKPFVEQLEALAAEARKMTKGLG